MKSIRWALPAFAALMLLGCFDSRILIKVKKDGSGTLEETVIISNSLFQMIESFSGDSNVQGPDVPLDREKLESKALEMGEGVKLVSAEPLSTEDGSGYRAVYSFKDIAKIRVNQNPGENVPAPPADPSLEEGQQAPVQEFLQFRFSKGKTVTLEILYPPETHEFEPQREEQLEIEQVENEEMLEMMKQLYQDMRMRLAVEVEGKIVETNASYRDGSTVVLMDVDFARLLEDEAKFKQLVTANPNSVEELRELLKDYPAIRMETQERVTIRFQ